MFFDGQKYFNSRQSLEIWDKFPKISIIIISKFSKISKISKNFMITLVPEKIKIIINRANFAGSWVEILVLEIYSENWSLVRGLKRREL